MSVKIKVPIKDVQKNSVQEIIERILNNDSENAYTIMGLMIQGFKVKEQDIDNKQFRLWKPGLPTLYTQVRIALDRLVKEGKVKKTKDGRAFVYWWQK